MHVYTVNVKKKKNKHARYCHSYCTYFELVLRYIYIVSDQMSDSNIRVHKTKNMLHIFILKSNLIYIFVDSKHFNLSINILSRHAIQLQFS